MIDVFGLQARYVGADRARRRAPAVSAPLQSALRSLLGLLARRGSYRVASPYPAETFLFRDKDFRRLGLHPREASVFQSVADDYLFDIFVRTGNASRVQNVGRAGLRPKPAGIYQKTSKDAFAGLVVYSDREKGSGDLDAVRHPDPLHSTRWARVLAEEGMHLRELAPGAFGVRDRACNFIYGDIDIHGVYQRNAERHWAKRITAHTFVPLFNDRLLRTGLYSRSLLEHGTLMKPKDFGVLPHHPIQHGAHDEWPQRNDPSYAGGVNMGPLPGVISFGPGKRAQYISTVPQYRDILASLGCDDPYTGPAWSNGRNRLAKSRYVAVDAF